MKPDITQGQQDVLVIHLDSFFRGTHLLPIFDGDQFLHHSFHHSYTLDSFHSHVVNKYIDHLAREMLFYIIIIMTPLPTPLFGESLVLTAFPLLFVLCF